jgi:hypothetical protein
MHGTLRSQIEEARAIERKLVRSAARICGPSNFSKAWKGIFPLKPAEALADLAGCSIRTAEYELSGQQQPSAQSIAALVALCVPPWKKG